MLGVFLIIKKAEPKKCDNIGTATDPRSIDAVQDCLHWIIRTESREASIYTPLKQHVWILALVALYFKLPMASQLH